MDGKQRVTGRRHGRSLSLTLGAVAVLVPAGMAFSGTASRVDGDVLTWARDHLHAIDTVHPGGSQADLEPLRGMIGDATLVSFGEGLHGGAEPLEFRNRLFQFLVEQMGFTAIGIESGMVEGLEVNDYVLGGPGELKTVVANGFTNGFNRMPQENWLVQWMREYNADPKHSRKVQFYGLDASASEEGDTQAPLKTALRYLDKVDPQAAAALRTRLGSLIGRLNFSRFSDAPEDYTHLSQVERERVTAVIADMISLLQSKRSAYTAASSPGAYQLASRTAIGARQVNDYERQVPVGWTPEEGFSAVAGTVAIADRIKAENARWIVQQQGAGGKVFLFAHRDHIATALVTVHAPQPNRYHLPSALPQPPMMGMVLQPLYGKQLVTIGNLLGQDDSGCKAPRPPPPAGSLEGLLSSLNTPDFLLDLRSAPPAVAAWLDRPRELYGIDFPDSLAVEKAFDIVLFSHVVTPAIPCSNHTP